MPGFNLADYEPVEDRLAKFWADHPDGRVHTDRIPTEDSAEFIFLAEIYREATDKRAAATGWAQEFAGSSMVNKTSALENCETSAIGRALANLGYAPKGKRPSREEMSKTSASTTAARADEQAPSEPLRPAGAEGGPTPAVGHGAPPDLSPVTDSAAGAGRTAVAGDQLSPSEAGAPAPPKVGDSSSAAPNAAGTEAEGARQGSDTYGEGVTGSEGSPQPPTSRRDQLWSQLVQFAGTKRKALNAVNTTMKASWTEGHISDIPEDDLEHTLKVLLAKEGVA